MNYKLLPIYIYIILILIVLLLRFSYRIYKNNSKNLISANDIIFKDNKWENNYMFGLINYKTSQDQLIIFAKDLAKKILSNSSNGLKNAYSFNSFTT